LVLAEDDKCVACSYCIMACPYDTRNYNSTRPQAYYTDLGVAEYEQVGHPQHPKGSIEKCTFCVQRLRESKEPA
jgi:molybdopterin-containing oxidoreductase family iron-sulfur binding subunit